MQIMPACTFDKLIDMTISDLQYVHFYVLLFSFVKTKYDDYV